MAATRDNQLLSVNPGPRFDCKQGNKDGGDGVKQSNLHPERSHNDSRTNVVTGVVMTANDLLATCTALTFTLGSRRGHSMSLDLEAMLYLD